MENSHPNYFSPSLLVSKVFLNGYLNMSAAHVVLVCLRHLSWDWLGVKILGHMTTKLRRHWLGALHRLQCHLWVRVCTAWLSKTSYLAEQGGVVVCVSIEFWLKQGLEDRVLLLKILCKNGDLPWHLLGLPPVLQHHLPARLCPCSGFQCCRSCLALFLLCSQI